ncbi:DUF4433 domain-containing protein [Vibrio antiquarius]|uniref:DUF4433 domain-containing protein n=1 Tax=Vibrio antiquarius (strain Ex25) TaxID=150340 RepID=UPI002657D827|nr:DUF4433 domain-containing protein [Vibrio antiquarius]MCR9476174.1 DUF4433 domain-containing protein [Vibrio antiquarius]
MKKSEIQKGKELYHFTALDNLPSILSSKLLPRKGLKGFVDVANKEILKGRDKFDLDEMVPFHFFPNNPFDGKVCQLNPATKFAFIVVRRVVAKSNGWKITPRHPLSGDFKLMSYDEGIADIDWETMNKKDFKDPESKIVCMAECLALEAVVPSTFHAIYVATEEDRKEVQKTVTENGLRMFVEVKPLYFPGCYKFKG